MDLAGEEGTVLRSAAWLGYATSWAHGLGWMGTVATARQCRTATRGQLDEEAARTATRGGEEVSGLWDHWGWGKGAIIDSSAET